MIPWVNDVEEPSTAAKSEVPALDELESLHKKYDKKPLVTSFPGSPGKESSLNLNPKPLNRSFVGQGASRVYRSFEVDTLVLKVWEAQERCFRISLRTHGYVASGA